MSKDWMHYTPEQAKMLVQFHSTYGQREQRQDVLEYVPAEPCQAKNLEPCGNSALWRFNGYAVCDECILAMARMNSDNAEAFLPALARMVIVERAGKDYWLCADAIGYLVAATGPENDQRELARCTTCQSVLCGVCGLCHSFDIGTGATCDLDEFGITDYHCESWALAHTAINEVKAKYHLM